MEIVPSRWDDLPPDLVKRIASLLPHAVVACTLRLINKAASELLRSNQQVRLSEPVPHHAFVTKWTRLEVLRQLTLKQRRQIIVLTARSGCVANLQVALAALGCPLTEEVFIAAAGAGHTDMCRWLLDRDCPCGKATAAAAARAGHHSLLQWLLQQQHDPAEQEARGLQAWAAAAGSGHWHVCEGLLADGVPCSVQAPIASARAGHVGLTDWLLQLPAVQHSLPASRDCDHRWDLFSAAAYGFDLPALQQLHAALMLPDPQNPWFYRRPIVEALQGPTPDWAAKVQWLGHMMMGRDGAAAVTAALAAASAGTPAAAPAHNCSLTDAEVAYVAADELVARPDAVDRLEVLLNLWYSYDTGPLPQLAMAAVRAGSLPLLRFLHRRSYLHRHAYGLATLAAEIGDMAVFSAMVSELSWRMDPATVRAAAGAGHLHVLQWLVSPEAPSAGGAVLAAALYPSLTAIGAGTCSVELMTWLRERGCPWDEGTFAAAAGAGCTEFLEWLLAQGYPMGSSGEPYLTAGANGDMLTLLCLRRLGCPWGPRGRTFSLAAYCCSLAVLRWMVEEGCPVDWAAASRLAQQRTGPHASVVRVWVEEQRVAVEREGGEDSGES